MATRWILLTVLVQQATAFLPLVRQHRGPTATTGHRHRVPVDRIHRFRGLDEVLGSFGSRRSVSLTAVKPSKLDPTTFSPMPPLVAVGSSSMASDEAGKWLSRFILLVVSAFYGTNFGCVKILNDSLDPSVSAVSRFTLASLVFLPFVLRVYKSKPQLVRGGLEVGAYNALGYVSLSLPPPLRPP